MENDYIEVLRICNGIEPFDNGLQAHLDNVQQYKLEDPVDAMDVKTQMILIRQMMINNLRTDNARLEDGMRIRLNPKASTYPNLSDDDYVYQTFVYIYHQNGEWHVSHMITEKVKAHADKTRRLFEITHKSDWDYKFNTTEVGW